MTRASPPLPQGSTPRRVAGLDTIRLAAAVCVAMSHGMLIPRQIYFDQGTRAAFWSGQIGHVLASGTAAVALFFVVSGLCIHLGRAAAEHNPLLFLARRIVRIGLPLASILLIISFAGKDALEVEKGVLWSVYCEIAYYLTYPLLLAARRRWSLERLFGLSVAASAVLLILLPAQQLIWQYGCWTAPICYPLWILGAMLAEKVPLIAAQKSQRLWQWRAGIVLAAGACALVRHLAWATDMSALTYVVTGLLAFPFLRQEIANSMAVVPSRLTESLGGASYSIYLVHRFPLSLVDRASLQWPYWMAASVELALVAACSFGFFFLCERPALMLARSISFAPVGSRRFRPVH